VLNARFLSDLYVHFEHACISIHPRVVPKSAERHREFMTPVARTCISCRGSCCKFFCFPTRIKSRLSRLKKYNINRILTTQHSHFWCTIFVFRASFRPPMFSSHYVICAARIYYYILDDVSRILSCAAIHLCYVVVYGAYTDRVQSHNFFFFAFIELNTVLVIIIIIIIIITANWFCISSINLWNIKY